MKIRYTKETLARFWSNVNLLDGFVTDEDCWLWTGYINDGGYGIFCIRRLRLRAHEFAYLVYKGMVPGELCVLHICDVRHCINPGHLYLGTRAKNAEDRVERDRVPKGSELPHAKLTEEQIAEIFKLRKEGLLHREIATKYNVCRQTISLVLGRKFWKHVTIN